MKKTICLIFGALLLLSGCAAWQGSEMTETLPPMPSVTSTEHEPTPIPAPETVFGTLKYPAPAMNDSPYADLPDGNYYWTYDIYSLYGGQAPHKFDPALKLSFPEGVQGPYETEENFTLFLPQIADDDAFWATLNAYYQAEYLRWTPELEARQREVDREYKSGDYEGSSTDIPHESVGIYCSYEWNGFVSLVFYDMSWAWRSFCDYDTDVFDRETMQRLTLDDLFKGAREEYGPVLESTLAEKGYYLPEIIKIQAEEMQGWLWPVDSIPLSENFLLTPNGLAFEYDTGTVSCIAAGSVTLLLPYEDISDLMKPDIYERLTAPA